MPHPDLPLPPLPLIVLDTETTGFIPKVHRVIEFASVEVRDGKVVKEYEQLLSAKEIPPVVQVITRIKPDHLAGKPTFEEKRDEITKHIPEDAIVVGQNTNFDIGMLRGEGIDLRERPMLDTSMLASLLFPELDSYSLGYLSRVLKLNHNPPHRALGDVRATLELLSRCWERMLELTPAAQKDALEIAGNAPEGIRRLFEALPKATAKKNPSWFQPVELFSVPASSETVDIKPPAKDVQLREESLDAAELQRVIEGALRSKTKERTWIAVKNLRLSLERLPDNLGERGVGVLYPPHLLLDPEAEKRFQAQKTFTNDEATLALKLRWLPADKRMQIAVHGGEEAIWNGKIAATAQSTVYQKQFNDVPGVVLLEHRDLLQMLEQEDHVGHDLLLKEPAHVIIDDASMLEDTATKAYGWYVSVDTLRAAAEGNALLTKFLDTFQLWIEKTRQFQDLRYLTSSDLNSQEAKGLSSLLSDVLKGHAWTEQITRMLGHLQKILDPANLPHRILWIEQNRQGSHYVQSVPERVGTLLKEMLFSRIPTTLLIPAGSSMMLPEILPPGHNAPLSDAKETGCRIPLSPCPDIELQDILEQPPKGKSIVLVGSRSQIDDAFVKHTEILESKGIAMICQGSSGGQGRMTSEFLCADGDVLWLLTPWMFEGIDLPPETADRLILATLPFDHPSHAVLSRRAESYRDPFNEYSLPRLLHRLFRLLRTYSRFKKGAGDVLLLDTRLQTKSYGQKILKYLEQFDGPRSSTAPMDPPKAKVKTVKKKGAEGPQLTMF